MLISTDICPTVGKRPSCTAKMYFRIKREEEDRDRDPEERKPEREVVEGLAVLLRGEKAERDADRHREERGGERELEGRGKPLSDLGQHRLPRRDRRAELELRGLLEIAPVLHIDGLIEAVLMIDLLDRRGCRAFAEERLGGAARERPDPDEDEDREPEQDRDEQQKSANDEPEHSKF